MPRIQFDWLTNGPYVRSNLRDLRSAARKGHFDGQSNAAKRVALYRAIERLQKEPGLSARAQCGIFLLMMEIDDPFSPRVVSR